MPATTPPADPDAAPPRLPLIVNPSARSSRNRGLAERLVRLHPPPRLVPTRGPGDAEALARELARQGARAVVVAGGDGTLNEAANGLAGTSTAMGILPCGTANVLARELGIPRDLPRAWTLANGAPARPVDLVRAEYRGREGRPCARRFVQVAGVGLDALLVRNVEGGASKARWGRLGYALELLRSWRTPLPRITLEIDGSERLEGAFALFGNGRLYAGPFEVFHGAAMDDGFLDVRLFLSRSPRHLFACVRDMLLGVPQDPARVLSRRTREVSVEAPSPVPLELDGEYVGEMPGRLRVEPLALKVQAPEPDGEGRTARPPPGA